MPVWLAGLVPSYNMQAIIIHIQNVFDVNFLLSCFYLFFYVNPRPDSRDHEGPPRKEQTHPTAAQ